MTKKKSLAALLASLAGTIILGHALAQTNPGTSPLSISKGGTGATTLAGVDANVLNSKTSNYTIGTTDCGKTVQAGTGSTGLFTVTLPAVAGFDAICKVVVVNGDTGRGKALSGFPTGTNPILWPKQSITVGIVNGAWVAIENPGRWKLSAATTFNVDPASGSDASTNDCLGTGSGACLTFNTAYASKVVTQIDTGNQTVTIKGVNATYTQTISVGSPYIGGGQVVFSCNTATPTSCPIAPGSAQTAAFLCTGPIAGYVKVEGFSFSSANLGVGIYASSRCTVAAGNNNYGTVTIAHMVANNAWIGIVSSTYTISAGAPAHASNTFGGMTEWVSAPTVTITGTPAFTAFFIGTAGGLFSAAGTTWSGAATGLRFSLQSNAVLSTGACTTTPGNAAGVTATGGVCG